MHGFSLLDIYFLWFRTTFFEDWKSLKIDLVFSRNYIESYILCNSFYIILLRKIQQTFFLICNIWKNYGYRLHAEKIIYSHLHLVFTLKSSRQTTMCHQYCWLPFWRLGPVLIRTLSSWFSAAVPETLLSILLWIANNIQLTKMLFTTNSVVKYPSPYSLIVQVNT